MSALATTDQVRAIQTARRRQGLDEPAYRAALQGFGVISTKELTADQARAFLDRLNGSERSARHRATGPFAGKLQALWIAAWNLGVVRVQDDDALIAFVERQTGITHTRFLRDPIDAAKAIEAVKAMLTRAGVVWPSGSHGRDPIHQKRAILAEQIRRLHACGEALDMDLSPLSRASGPQLDALSKRLGVAVRRVAGTTGRGGAA